MGHVYSEGKNGGEEEKAKSSGASDQGSDRDEASDKDADDNKIFDDLDEELKSKADDYQKDIIALLKAPNEQVKDKVKELKQILGEFEVDDTYSIIPGFAGKLSKKQILAMAALDDTLQIEPDVEVKAFLNTATSWSGVQKARTDFTVDGDADGNPALYSNDDIVIAVIDTGIDPNHNDLDSGKIIGWKDIINGRTTPYDDNGHGTHVAGIAAGEGQANSAYAGVAPRAALVGVKVLNSAGSGTTSGVISGMDWVKDNKALYGIEVANLSLGSSGCSSGTDGLSLAVNNAVSNGIVVVVAAGNSGPGTCTVGSPAAAAGATTVGAMADAGEKGFSLASFSSRGPTADGRIKPDVVAPGVSITAAARGTTGGYTTMSGTSMASPFVAGVAALMLNANPSLTPSNVKSKIMATAVDWGPAGNEIDHGSGRLDGYEAIRNAPSTPSSGTNIAVPTHTFISDSLPGTGSFDTWSINVLDATYPIGVVMIMTTWTSSTSPDLDMRLFNPSGTQIASSLGVTRQETIGASISTTGTYTLRVESYTGSGPYFLDISSGSDPPPPPAPTAPSAPQSLVANGGNAQVTLSWSAPSSDGGSAVTNYKVYRGTSSGALALKTNIATVGNVLTYNDVTVTNGVTYFYQVTALNSVGESVASNEASTTPTAPDNTVPSITGATGNTASTTGEAVTVSATITDNQLVSSATVHYTPIGGTETTVSMTQGASNLWSASVPVAANAVGSIHYYITATDPASNNARDPAVGTYTITVTDNDAPTTTITSPSNGAILGGTVVISATASDNIGVTSVEFFDGLTSMGTDTTAPYSISWTSGTDGAHNLTAKASDAAGNLGSHTITVTVDNTAPTSPTLSATVVSSTQIDLSWTASADNTGVTEYRVYRDGVLRATLSSTATSYSDTGLTPATTYSYQIRVRDAVGNEAASNTATVTTLSPPAASISIATHTETVRDFEGNQLRLRSIVTAAASGTPTNVNYTYTFDSTWRFRSIQGANLVINGVTFDIKALATVTGNTITFNLGSFAFNDGDSVRIQIDSRYTNVASGTYSLTTAFDPGTSDTKQIVAIASAGD